MKALYYDGTGVVYKENVLIPERRPHESLIRILLADICSTDKEILRGYRPDFRGIMGHEFVGIVEDSDDKSLIGRTVVGELNEGCGTCLYCRTGRAKHCLSRSVMGLSKDGCFAEYMTLATDLLHLVPEGLEAENAVFTEPLAAAIEILKQVKIDPSLNACIVGDGRLAFMICQVLALTGIDLTVIGHHEEKLKLFTPYAKVKLNVEHEEHVEYADHRNHEEHEGCAEYTKHMDKAPLGYEDTYEYVVDASGSPGGLALSLDLVRKMGTIILKSTYAGTANIDMSRVVVDEITIVGSRCGPFEPALKLLSDRRVTFPPVELYELEDYEKAFASKAFKAGFRF